MLSWGSYCYSRPRELLIWSIPLIEPIYIICFFDIGTLYGTPAPPRICGLWVVPLSGHAECIYTLCHASYIDQSFKVGEISFRFQVDRSGEGQLLKRLWGIQSTGKQYPRSEMYDAHGERREEREGTT